MTLIIVGVSAFALGVAAGIWIAGVVMAIEEMEDD